MVEKTKPEIVWSNKASFSLRKAYEYIKEESSANAEKVMEGILKLIENLSRILQNIPLISSRKITPEIIGRLKNTHTE